jgi:hypothetical protein
MEERKSCGLCHLGRSGVTSWPAASCPRCQLQALLLYFFLSFLIPQIVQNTSDVRFVIMKLASKLHVFLLIFMSRRQWRFVISHPSAVTRLGKTLQSFQLAWHFIYWLHKLLCWAQGCLTIFNFLDTLLTVLKWKEMVTGLREDSNSGTGWDISLFPSLTYQLWLHKTFHPLFKVFRLKMRGARPPFPSENG